MFADEHTPARAKKQAGRESFCGFLPACEVALLRDPELALDVALHDARAGLERWNAFHSSEACDNVIGMTGQDHIPATG